MTDIIAGMEIITVSLTILFVTGLFLPAVRTTTKRSVLEAPPEIVYAVVTDNTDWYYRSDLKGLNIISVDGDMEAWEEIPRSGIVIRFKTKTKVPSSFYSFDMKSKLMSGYWEARFDHFEGDRTLFTATEYIRLGNPFIRTLSYLFFDIDRFMETYQNDLRKKIEDVSTTTGAMETSLDTTGIVTGEGLSAENKPG